MFFPPSPILKSRHSSTKISNSPFRGKASGRVATSRFIAGRIKPYPTSAFRAFANSTFLIILHSNLDSKLFSLVLQGFLGFYQVRGFMQKESNFLLMDAKKARHRPSSFVKISDCFLSILAKPLPIFPKSPDKKTHN